MQAERMGPALRKIITELTELRKSQQAFREMRQEAMATGQMLTTGAGIGAGLGAFNAALRVTRSLLSDTLREGVEFNDVLGNAQRGIAAVTMQSDPSRFRDFGQAMAASADAIKLLKKEAATSPDTFRGLVGTFQATVGAMTAAGIPLKNQTALLNNLGQGIKGLGIESNQILQETRALITGNIGPDAMAAKTLGITSGDIARAKEAGKLYEYLTAQFAPFKDAAEAGAKSLGQLRSNLTDNYQAVAAENTEELTAAMAKLYEQLGEFVGSEDFGDLIRYVADGATMLTGELTDLVKWVKENGTAVKQFGEIAIWTAGALTMLAGVQKLQGRGGVFTASLVPVYDRVAAALLDGPSFGRRFAEAMGKAVTAAKSIMAAMLIAPGATLAGAAGNLGRTLGSAIATPMGSTAMRLCGSWRTARRSGPRRWRRVRSSSISARPAICGSGSARPTWSRPVGGARRGRPVESPRSMRMRSCPTWNLRPRRWTSCPRR